MYQCLRTDHQRNISCLVPDDCSDVGGGGGVAVGRGLLGGRQPLRNHRPDRAQRVVRVAAPNV